MRLAFKFFPESSIIIISDLDFIFLISDIIFSNESEPIVGITNVISISN